MRFFATGMTLACVTATAALATESTLPQQLAITSYGTGSSGYNQSVAIGAALQDHRGVNLRILPAKNDVARTEPLRQGKVDFSMNGVGGTFMAQEGVYQFGAKSWGPMPIRALASNNSGTVGISLGVAAEVCEQVGKPNCEGFTYADLKGKRVAWLKGAPSMNVNAEAYLAYAGLTADDVELVEFGGFGASWKGMVDGSVDAAIASTSSGKGYEAASGPRGLFWPEIDPDNAEGLARMRDVAPFFAPMVAKVGATIDGTDGVPTAGYAFPVLMTLADRDPDLVYGVTKAMFELYDNYNGTSPGIDGWSLDHQALEWVVPYHEGAIRYFREVGVWTEAHDAHNARMIERQQVLDTAWQGLEAENPENWDETWAERRREALVAAGFPVFY
ncbi:TAXI family TRAP transporter solute-binding subunit [Sedimentitalea sp. JM2-8]|uniref:TAXI family TRAP transporter solute-binding subunit n=1 Tax=Sedimentitalea xiamensis TaxID=3050037 RepID=A0ABT7FHE9_9RHOB|nr:TAXI family TRAP transporter solute-binding subunit [Sedimentitalea xiamensis]MDK3074517.1 TAXI family TRAP transporter solute-binding subunit [Sedimentitalea xiamensis]